PSSATVTIARPVGPSTARTPASPTPAERRPDSPTSDWASVPTAPIISTLPPSLAAATAWLAPLPPGVIRPPRPWRVSPGRGWRTTWALRSTLIEPTTAIVPAGLIGPRIVLGGDVSCGGA